MYDHGLSRYRYRKQDIRNGIDIPKMGRNRSTFWNIQDDQKGVFL